MYLNIYRYYRCCMYVAFIKCLRKHSGMGDYPKWLIAAPHIIQLIRSKKYIYTAQDWKVSDDGSKNFISNIQQQELMQFHWKKNSSTMHPPGRLNMWFKSLPKMLPGRERGINSAWSCSNNWRLKTLGDMVMSNTAWNVRIASLL